MSKWYKIDKEGKETFVTGTDLHFACRKCKVLGGWIGAPYGINFTPSYQFLIKHLKECGHNNIFISYRSCEYPEHFDLAKYTYESAEESAQYAPNIVQLELWKKFITHDIKRLKKIKKEKDDE